MTNSSIFILTERSSIETNFYLFARFYSVFSFTLQTIHVSVQNAAIKTDGSAADASPALAKNLTEIVERSSVVRRPLSMIGRPIPLLAFAL